MCSNGPIVTRGTVGISGVVGDIVGVEVSVGVGSGVFVGLGVGVLVDVGTGVEV